MVRTLGEGPFEVEWANRFRIHLRSAPSFRVGRVLLAGDAAHIHSPAGGLGMNSGIQDAHNLAWKLGVALDGGDVERLLQSYDMERRRVVVEDVSAYADFATKVFLQAPAGLRAAAFFLLRLGLGIASARKALLRRLTMIGLDYETSPLLETGAKGAGCRLPNPLLVRRADNRETRLYDIVPNAPFILRIAETFADEVSLPVDDMIRIGTGGYDDRSGLLRRLTGGQDGWILVRPDLHVAWTGDDARKLCEIAGHALGRV